MQMIMIFIIIKSATLAKRFSEKRTSIIGLVANNHAIEAKPRSEFCAEPKPAPQGAKSRRAGDGSVVW